MEYGCKFMKNRCVICLDADVFGGHPNEASLLFPLCVNSAVPPSRMLMSLEHVRMRIWFPWRWRLHEGRFKWLFPFCVWILVMTATYQLHVAFDVTLSPASFLKLNSQEVAHEFTGKTK